MGKSTHRPSVWRYPFWIVFLSALLIYGLRGWGLVTFLPGGVILGLVAMAIALGIPYGLDQTRRF